MEVFEPSRLVLMPLCMLWLCGIWFCLSTRIKCKISGSAKINVICEDTGSVDFFTRDFTLMILLSLAFENYGFLKLFFSSLASWLKSRYCVLRADMYLHYFVA